MTAFDSVGPSSSGAGHTGTTALTWSHTTVGSSTDMFIGVEIDGVATSSPATCTVDGNSATSLGLVATNAGNQGFVQMFRKTGLSSGAHSLSVSYNAGALDAAGGSIAFTGATGVGTVFTALGASTVNVTGTVSGNMVVAFCASGNNITASSGGSTSRFLNNLMNTTGDMAGNVAGETLAAPGGTATMSWTVVDSTFTGVIAAEVLGATDATVVLAPSQQSVTLHP